MATNLLQASANGFLKKKISCYVSICLFNFHVSKGQTLKHPIPTSYLSLIYDLFTHLRSKTRAGTWSSFCLCVISIPAACVWDSSPNIALGPLRVEATPEASLQLCLLPPLLSLCQLTVMSSDFHQRAREDLQALNVSRQSVPKLHVRLILRTLLSSLVSQFYSLIQENNN